MIEPIYIDCEGSDCPTHYPAKGLGTCQMCGKEVQTCPGDGWAVKHKRLHVLAMYGRVTTDEGGQG